KRVALVIDVRGEEFFGQLSSALANLEDSGFDYQIVFLEASEEVLVKRFKESRRPHPLAPEGGILDGLEKERALLADMRARANYVIDTTNLSARELRAEISAKFGDPSSAPRIGVTVVSFGFKLGIPKDADMVFDVRFLPNPHYVESLRPLTGNAPEVRQYVLRWPVTKRFLHRAFDLLKFLLPEYVREGKSNLVVAVGCTGGKHRSVTIANRITEYLREEGYRARAVHRDVEIPIPETPID
ncbi:MAG: RNase adapter RapZ, partial [Firmicutes bacterium]|nr:RNase adapter RapZ [Bacillota bacterium]